MNLRFGNLFPQVPTTLVIGGMFISAGTILGGILYLFGGNWVAVAILGGGLVLVMLLLLVYLLILKWIKKRKANPLSQGIAGNAAATPQGISEPARRARLDDLRRNFEQGVEKFRAAGKNLYSVPWYVLVGEPGSGKTEAIRHCNVGFPPGLQDQLQGAGGTLNMNWWFTNQAIILDTAGRLMFEEVVPGTTNEWNEFLKLLKASRPNCPINGMLLVIPVDTLIKDTADQIEKKATKIAQQFDQIQRTIGVRFPVFVIITKCDLLNGFREFFDDLNDPQLQHQIMGWSNPAPLDERFDPATVMNHLETVKSRLIERRRSLLLDPVNTEDPQSRRIDQVDALYALPDSITKIGPRLRRYLEMIFVAGEWSPKPLFLRGIYFTSSMTEGSALDAELAEVLGVPVDSLPEGRVWRRDRAYFLRDLFIEKVFREKGLVTRATNAGKQQRTRRLVVMAFGFVAVFVLFAVTWLGARQLSDRIGGHRDFWETAARFNPAAMSILERNAYNAEADIGIGNTKVSRAELFARNLPLVQSRIDVPFIFKPMTWISGDVDTKRPDAFRALFESTVLHPAFELTRRRIPASAESWSPKATAALAELMKLEFAQATGKPLQGADVPHPHVDLDALFAYVLSEEDYENFKKDREGLQKVADWAYTAQANGERQWPARRLAPGTETSLETIRIGINATLAYWKNQTGDRSPALASINEMRAALLEFETAERALLNLKNQPIDRINIYNEFHGTWQTHITALRAAVERANKAWLSAAGSSADSATLGDLYSSQITRAAENAQKAYNLLLQCTPEAPPNVDPASLNASHKALLDARTRLQTASSELAGWRDSLRTTLTELARLDTTYITPIKGLDNATHRRYQVTTQLYELATSLLVKAGDPSAAVSGPLEAAFARTDTDYGDAVSAAKQLQIQAESPADAIALTQFAIETSARARKFLYADQALAAMPADPARWPEAVAAIARNGPQEAIVRPPVPLVTFAERTFSAGFAPEAAGRFADDLEIIRRSATAADATTRVLDSASLASRAATTQRGLDSYRAEYIRYWRDTVKEELTFSYSKFADLADALANVSSVNIFEQLKKYGDQMVYALNRLGARQEAEAIRLAPQVSQDECKLALGNWTNLGNDPRQVRRAILAMPANEFRENYTVMTARSNDSFVGRYWQGLPVAALRVLVTDGRAEIEAGLTELARYERFPLAAPADIKDELTLAEVLAARAALEKIRGAGMAVVATTGAALAPGARPIGQGGLTANRDVDAQLDLLRGTNLLRDKQEYFDKLERFFVALPTEDKALSVDIAVAKDKLRGVQTPVTVRYAYMDISQKDAAGTNRLLRSASLSSLDVVDQCAVEYPGGAIVLEFRETPPAGGAAAPVLQTETIGGLWAPLRLLNGSNTKSVSRDGNKLTVEYLVKAPNNIAYSLFLTLEFKQPVPDVKDWPVPPARLPG